MFERFTEKKVYRCWECQHELEMETRVQRRDECPACGADLHACKNCRFWDPSYHNECRENIAHFIRDREKANFCMSFTFKSSTDADAEEADDARTRLEDLFSKLK